MEKQELEHGKWYKLIDNNYLNCILQFNTKGYCKGYWRKTWGVSWGFPLSYAWELATYADLERLGTKHREHYTFTLEDLANGVCSLKNDGTEEETFEPSYAGNIREFETGSRRDDDSDKPLVNHLDPYLRLRFGYLLRQGANKYDKGNWKKGQPTETALESLHRHLAKFELNLQNGVEQDEDHLSALIFNVMLIMKQEEKDGIEANHYYGTLK